MKLKLLALAPLLAASSYADLPWEPTFSWTYGNYSSGQPVTQADVQETRVYCNGNTEPTFVVLDTDSVTAAFKQFQTGQHECYAQAQLASQVTDPSNTVNFTVPVDKAGPLVLSVD